MNDLKKPAPVRIVLFDSYHGFAESLRNEISDRANWMPDFEVGHLKSHLDKKFPVKNQYSFVLKNTFHEKKYDFFIPIFATTEYLCLGVKQADNKWGTKWELPIGRGQPEWGEAVKLKGKDIPQLEVEGSFYAKEREWLILLDQIIGTGLGA